MCRNGPEFSTDLVKWKQEIIDELNDAIDNCECGCTQALVDDMRSLHGQASYVPHWWGNISWVKNEWFVGEPDNHWHFQWVYQADYDYSEAVGGGYGADGMHGVGHTCIFRVEWWYWPWEGPMEYLSSEEDHRAGPNQLRRHGDGRTRWHVCQDVSGGLPSGNAADRRHRASHGLGHRRRRVLLSEETPAMSFPACPSAFDSRTPAGRVVHRVCLAEEKPTCRMAVTARACQVVPGTED